MKLRIIGISLILVAIIFGAIYGSKYYAEYSHATDSTGSASVEQEARDNAAKAKKKYLKKSNPEIEVEVLSIDEEEGKKIRVLEDDVVGKLTITACNIEALVYENAEDDYYLRKDASGNESRHGEIYTNCYDCDVPIIYGHHMSDGTMFAGLDVAYRGASVILEDIGWMEDLTRNFVITEIHEDVPAEEFWSLVDDVDADLILVTCSYGVEDGRLVVFCKEGSPAE